MKIEKHGHACLVLTQGNNKLVIDPGSYTESMAGLSGVVAVVITHQHDDHCFSAQVSAIKSSNPDAKIFGPLEVAEKLSDFEVVTVRHGDFHQVAEFRLEFYGDLHQEIHRSIPLVQNTGVLVNGLYYPGDSYTQPEHRPEILAMPASAPWLRISDAIDYLEVLKPKRAFPTHNILLSEIGHKVQNGRIKEVVERHGGEFRFLEVGDSWEL